MTNFMEGLLSMILAVLPVLSCFRRNLCYMGLDSRSRDCTAVVEIFSKFTHFRSLLLAVGA